MSSRFSTLQAQVEEVQDFGTRYPKQPPTRHCGSTLAVFFANEWIRFVRIVWPFGDKARIDVTVNREMVPNAHFRCKFADRTVRRGGASCAGRRGARGPS